MGVELGLPAVATSAASAAAAATTGALTRFIDVQCTAVEVLAIKCFHRGFRLTVVVHGHETESAGAAGLTVCNDGDIVHGSMSAKRFAYGVFVRIKVQIAYVKFQITDSGTRGPGPHHSWPIAYGDKLQKMPFFKGDKAFQYRSLAWSSG